MKKRYLLLNIIVAMILSMGTLLADKPGDLPKMLGANNVGKEFWLTIPPCLADESGSISNYIGIYVTSAFQTNVTLEVPGKNYTVTKQSIANDVIEFVLEPSIAFPYLKAGPEAPPAEKVYEKYGIHISADEVITVYCVVRYFATSDGYLAIPASSLGTDYVISPYTEDPMFTIMNYRLPSQVGVVAAFDSTNLTFTLGGNVNTKTVGGLSPGQSITVSMNKGDVWMASNNNSGGDLTGSIISSNYPVAVISGNNCTNVPVGNRWCDYTVEQDLPTYTWGTNCLVPSIIDRGFPSILRVFAKEPNTNIYRNGIKIGTIVSYGGLQDKGWFEIRAYAIDDTINAQTPALITGDKPINVVLYNTGAEEDIETKGYVTDPFSMSITPYEQYSNQITFCTPGIFNQSGFPENFLALIYQSDSDGNPPEDLYFGIVNNGSVSWTLLKDAFPGAGALVKNKVNGIQFAQKTLTLPKIGVYQINSSSVFSAYSYGYGYCDSYGYPASTNYVDINSNDTTAPSIMLTSSKEDEDNGIYAGTVEDVAKTTGNGLLASTPQSNLSLIELYTPQSYNYKFSYDKYIPGKDFKTNWKLTPIDDTKPAKAVLIFTDRCANYTTCVYTYKELTSVAEGTTEDNNVKIYPNPTANETNIIFNNIITGDVNVKIFDLKGNIVKNENANNFSSKELKLDLTNLPNGAYYISISIGTQVITKNLNIVK